MIARWSPRRGRWCNWATLIYLVARLRNRACYRGMREDGLPQLALWIDNLHLTAHLIAARISTQSRRNDQRSAWATRRFPGGLYPAQRSDHADL